MTSESSVVLSNKICNIIDDVGKLQVLANSKGWTFDFESIIIALEGHSSTAEWYESQETDSESTEVGKSQDF